MSPNPTGIYINDVNFARLMLAAERSNSVATRGERVGHPSINALFRLIAEDENLLQYIERHLTSRETDLGDSGEYNQPGAEIGSGESNAAS